VNYTCSSW